MKNSQFVENIFKIKGGESIRNALARLTNNFEIDNDTYNFELIATYKPTWLSGSEVIRIIIRAKHNRLKRSFSLTLDQNGIKSVVSNPGIASDADVCLIVQKWLSAEFGSVDYV